MGTQTSTPRAPTDSKRRTRAGGRKPAGFDSLEQQAFLNLWRSYDLLKALEDELFGRYDLTAQQYNALRLLRAEQAAGLQTLSLASRLVSRAPDITRLVDKLADRGLVSRHRPTDNRRVVQVAITKAGIALLNEVGRELRSYHQRQLGHMSVQKLRTLIALLREARAPHEDPHPPTL